MNKLLKIYAIVFTVCCSSAWCNINEQIAVVRQEIRKAEEALTTCLHSIPSDIKLDGPLEECHARCFYAYEATLLDIQNFVRQTNNPLLSFKFNFWFFEEQRRKGQQQLNDTWISTIGRAYQRAHAPKPKEPVQPTREEDSDSGHETDEEGALVLGPDHSIMCIREGKLHPYGE